MIATFYSYKGGVGRSMALANVADALSRDHGLRVLMIDFDLEAPGLEQFFRNMDARARSHAGLLDLLLSYKRAMSTAAVSSNGTARFKRLREEFIVSVFEQLPSGGRLDLLPAGLRGDEEQLSRYALNLRTFDWEDFYFNWEGEAFFEWLRSALVPNLYDVVLVDSRTGVTEMGGVCAYQLADSIVMLAGSNRQNLDGTRNVVENFFSPRVQALRADRPLQILVVPARVEQRDEQLVEELHSRFDKAFAPYTPLPLQREGRTLWDLLIPYEPRYAFEEQVISQPSRGAERRSMAAAYANLVDALSSLATPGSPLATVRGGNGSNKPAHPEPQYDATQRFADYDVYLSGGGSEKPTVTVIAEQLAGAGLKVFDGVRTRPPGEPWPTQLDEVVTHCKSVALFFGPGGSGTWQRREIDLLLARQTVGDSPRLIPVLLPGSELPRSLATYTVVDLRAGVSREALDQLAAAIRVPLPVLATTSVDDGPPYRGLLRFEEEHADQFFGRETELAALMHELQATDFLAVVGSSGSGKSSLVRAGLLPRLRRDGMRGRHVDVRIVQPGPRPLTALALAVVDSSNATEHVYLAEQVASSMASDTDALAHVLGGRATLLFVDQFEEVFTLTHAEYERDAFIANLVRASSRTSHGCTVMLAMRADFYAQCLQYRDLAELLGRHTYPLGWMDSKNLRRAIEQPARAVGLALEPGLVDRILADTQNEAGALPLMQFALFELWQRRDGGWLTNAAYSDIGGVAGSLAQQADATYDQLSRPEQAIARRILLRLTQPGEGTEDTRRQAPLDELVTSGDRSDVGRVIRVLVDARLLSTSSDNSGVVTVDLAHEALIRAWPRLQEWIAEDRAGLVMLRRLSAAALDWQQHDQDEDLLARGARLAEYQAWRERASYATYLNSLEAAFLGASRDRAARERKATARRRRVLLAAAFAVLIAFVGVAWWAKVQQDRADAETARVLLVQKVTNGVGPFMDARLDDVVATTDGERTGVVFKSPEGRFHLLVGVFQRSHLVILSVPDSGTASYKLDAGTTFAMPAYSTETDVSTTRVIAGGATIDPADYPRQFLVIRDAERDRTWVIPAGVGGSVWVTGAGQSVLVTSGMLTIVDGNGAPIAPVAASASQLAANGQRPPSLAELTGGLLTDTDLLSP